MFRCIFDLGPNLILLRGAIYQIIASTYLLHSYYIPVTEPCVSKSRYQQILTYTVYSIKIGLLERTEISQAFPHKVSNKRLNVIKNHEIWRKFSLGCCFLDKILGLGKPYPSIIGLSYKIGLKTLRDGSRRIENKLQNCKKWLIQP